MKVFIEEAGGWRRIGDADVVDDGLPEHTIRLFGSSSTIEERFRILNVVDPTEGAVAGERIVLASFGQLTELLPNWRPLAR